MRGSMRVMLCALDLVSAASLFSEGVERAAEEALMISSAKHHKRLKDKRKEAAMMDKAS